MSGEEYIVCSSEICVCLCVGQITQAESLLVMGLDGPSSIPGVGKVKIFLHSFVSKLVVGSTQPPIKWVPWAFFLESWLGSQYEDRFIHIPRGSSWPMGQLYLYHRDVTYVIIKCFQFFNVILQHYILIMGHVAQAARDLSTCSTAQVWSRMSEGVEIFFTPSYPDCSWDPPSLL